MEDIQDKAYDDDFNKAEGDAIEPQVNEEPIEESNEGE